MTTSALELRNNLAIDILTKELQQLLKQNELI